eukprot:gene9372-10359_t
MIESQRREVAKLKTQIEVRDAKQLVHLKDINDHLKTVTKDWDNNNEDVKDVINAFVIKKCKDAQVDDEVFEEFLEFASLITSLNEKINDLIEVQERKGRI